MRLFAAGLFAWAALAQTPQPSPFSGNGGGSGTSIAGDVTGTLGASTVVKLRGVPVCTPLTTTNTFILTYNSGSGCIELAANGGASGSVTTGGLTTNTIPKASGASALSDSTITDDGTTIGLGGRVDIKANPFIIELPNSSTGTTNNKLAKIVNTAGVLQAQIITTSSADQAAAVGCVISGGGTTGTALIMIAGTGSCYFDGPTTAGHIAVPSSTSAGALSDSGSASAPASGEILATVGATNACGSPPCLIAGNLFMTPDIVSTGGNGNGGGNGNNGNGSKQQGHAFTCNIGSATSTTVIATGDTGCYSGNGPYSGTINAVAVTGNAASLATCSITVDVWKANAAYPTSGNKISASAPATLSSAKTNDAGSVGTWTKAVASNDRWGASVASVTGCVYAQVQVFYQ